jgi:hypothetical protein
MRSITVLSAAFVLVMCMSAACAINEDGSARIKSELESKGLAAQVTYAENSTYGLPGYVIVINMTDDDYQTATRRAMIAAAPVVGGYPNCAIIGLIGSNGKAYQLKINNIDMFDIKYENFDSNLDASKERAERYFDSAIVTTPEELMAYFRAR